MKSRVYKIILVFMIAFIFLHTILAELHLSTNPIGRFVSILVGFSPSIVHDSISTRNPAVELFSAILSDLPGAYSMYFSPSLITVPEIENGTVNSQRISHLIGIRNPKPPHLTNLQMQQLSFLVFLILLFILSIIWIVIKRKRDKS